MGNVVSLTARTKGKVEETSKDVSGQFMYDFYDWARLQGIDTTTTRFKFDAAVVLTTIQSLLHERD